MPVTYLKLQNKTVMEFDKDALYYKVLDNDLLPFMIRGKITDLLGNDETRRPFEIAKIAEANTTALSTFFNYRSINMNRENARLVLNALGIPQNNDFSTKWQVMTLCNGLSAADDYWMTENNRQRWESVNVRGNQIYEPLAKLALFGSADKLSVASHICTAELTGQGAYAKGWYKNEDGKLYLYKAGGAGDAREAKCEALVSNILDCFNVPHVHYSLVKKGDKIVTKCEAMNNSDYSVADALDVDTWYTKSGKDFLAFAREVDSELFYKTIVVDYLVSNVDRHGGNWGFYMNNQTGELVGMHPLFDHNNAFWRKEMKEGKTPSQLMPGKTLKEAAGYAIKHCDFRCIKPVTHKMFFNEDIYKSFISRAVELGLYKKQKISRKGSEEYVPVSIKSDNTQEYWQAIEQTLNSQNSSAKRKTATQTMPQVHNVEVHREAPQKQEESGEALINRFIDMTVKNRRTMGVRESVIAATKAIMGTDKSIAAIRKTLMTQYVKAKSPDDVNVIKYVAYKAEARARAKAAARDRDSGYER